MCDPTVRPDCVDWHQHWHCVTVCGSARDIQCKDGHTANTRPRIGWYSGMSHASHSQDNRRTSRCAVPRRVQWESWDGQQSTNDNGVMGLRPTTAIQLLLLLTPSQLSVKHLSPAPCYQLSCLATEILKLSSVPLTRLQCYSSTSHQLDPVRAPLCNWKLLPCYTQICSNRLKYLTNANHLTLQSEKGRKLILCFKWRSF